MSHIQRKIYRVRVRRGVVKGGGVWETRLHYFSELGRRFLRGTDPLFARDDPEPPNDFSPAELRAVSIVATNHPRWFKAFAYVCGTLPCRGGNAGLHAAALLGVTRTRTYQMVDAFKERVLEVHEKIVKPDGSKGEP